jgi:Flp pilus assembly protein TadD
MNSMKKLPHIALIAALALSTAGCGRDDRQEKVGNAASKKDSAAATSSGTAATKGPLQTGETAPSKAAELPDGTKSGARTTPNPK